MSRRRPNREPLLPQQPEIVVITRESFNCIQADLPRSTVIKRPGEVKVDLLAFVEVYISDTPAPDDRLSNPCGDQAQTGFAQAVFYKLGASHSG